MSAVVIDLVSRQSVDEAWERYAELARNLADDSSLLWDRSFNEELTRRHERWKRLFMRMEGAK